MDANSEDVIPFQNAAKLSSEGSGGRSTTNNSDLSSEEEKQAFKRISVQHSSDPSVKLSGKQVNTPAEQLATTINNDNNSCDAVSPGPGVKDPLQAIEDEHERLVWVTKKHVKQMMEEAVTKKFIHEESSSIISLCAAIEACLSHGLKRRALGLFKTNSSAALVQKLAKTCPSAQEALEQAELEEKRIQIELHRQQDKKNIERRLCSHESNPNTSTINNNYSFNANGNVSNPQPKSPFFGQQNSNLRRCNSNIHKRNIWIKVALIERKLVPIIDHLAENASKYYEKDALMSNKVCAQILSSLLVGPCALEFSRSKTNDYYQYEEPSADELLRRHQLSFPIACLCSQYQTNDLKDLSSHGPLSRSATDGCSNNMIQRKVNNSLNQVSPSHNFHSNDDNNSISDNIKTNEQNLSSKTVKKSYNISRAPSPIGPQGALNRKESHRKRPLALKSNVKTGALVTDCHHYSCQEISEHQQTRGYSFRCTSSATFSATTTTTTTTASTGVNPNHSLVPTTPSLSNNKSHGNTSQTTVRTSLESSIATTTTSVVAQEWSPWSPRMLHETLHQNSKSRLLYAKNNVLLETQQSETIAGYLSLHQTNNDLILKWIPNQMINGSQRPMNNFRCQCPDLVLCECASSAHQSNGKTMYAPSDPTREDYRANPSVSRRGSCASITTSDKQQEQQPVALGSSYLDLVVNLSVSRIVLMHCHFGSPSYQKEQTNQQSNLNGNSNLEQHKQQQHETSSNNETSICSSDTTTQLIAQSIEDTLILVEADGVQRAPFKFPKGGLRWFLSCLENGLKPDKYLEPAIRPDDMSSAPDPLQELNSTDSTLASNGSDSPSVASEPAGGRLDMLLRRLPSLKRGFRQRNLRKNSQENAPNQSPEPIAVGRSLDSNNQPPALRSRNLPKLSNNYVYRIAFVSQPEWSLQTPPHSTSSTSSSVSRSICKQNEIQTSRGQKFRWSLSRLAKFSNIYSNSTSTASSSSVVCGQLSDGYDNNNGSLTGRSTLENNSLTDYTDGNSFDINNISENENDTNKVWSKPKTASSQDYIRVEAKLNNLKKSTSEEIAALRAQSIQTLCESMRKQILSRAFYGWLVYYRRAKIIRNHLVKLIKTNASCHMLDCESETYKIVCSGLTWTTWTELRKRDDLNESELSCQVDQFIYYGGIECDELRAEVWPYLLDHYKYKDTDEMKANKNESIRNKYEACAKEWAKIEIVVKKRDNELLVANMARAGSRMSAEQLIDRSNRISSADSDASATSCSGSQSDIAELSLDGSELDKNMHTEQQACEKIENNDLDSQEIALKLNTAKLSADGESTVNDGELHDRLADANKAITQKPRRAKQDGKTRTRRQRRRARLESTGSVGSDASITDRYGNNIHRIDKDVQRCDRNFHYFKNAKNLEKLRNIMCTYVWQHLDVGYVQGMCDLAAPFLVIFDDEVMAHTCFSQLMKRMVANFPQGSAMDQHFESLKYLMQILDPKLFEVLQCDGDYSHFYFCYRWLLLDFKRELIYADVYKVWEAIWSARHIITENFVVFVALAMVRYYRDIIIENNMDFTDTIKFFNEMAERHDADKILSLARDCVVEVENLISAVVIDAQD